MIPQNIIELAIKGGWGEGKFSGYFVDESQKPQYKNSIVLSCENPKGNVFVGYELNCNDITLDPLFWQALGKELGWTNNFWVGDIKRLLPSGELESVRWELTIAEQYAHRFFDLILTGGDTAKFWEELTNNN